MFGEMLLGKIHINKKTNPKTQEDKNLILPIKPCILNALFCYIGMLINDRY